MIKAPSVNALVTTFKLDSVAARLIRSLAHAADDASELEALIDTRCPATAAYVRQLYSSPYDSRMWRRTVVLHAIDVILGTCGVESFGDTDAPGLAPAYEYCNTGDSYDTTLVYHRNADAIRIGSWGDIAERI